MAKTRLKCGCTHDETKWLSCCEQHEQEWKTTHLRWAADRIVQEVSINASNEEAVPLHGVQAGEDDQY